MSQYRIVTVTPLQNKRRGLRDSTAPTKSAWYDFSNENLSFAKCIFFVTVCPAYQIDRYYELRLFSLLILCGYYGIRKLLNGMSYFAQLSNLDFEITVNSQFSLTLINRLNDYDTFRIIKWQ